MDLITVGTVITIFITIFTFFYKLIIIPLSDAITDLQNMIKEMRLDLQKENDLRNKFDIRLSVVEEKIKFLEGAKKWKIFWKECLLMVL